LGLVNFVPSSLAKVVNKSLAFSYTYEFLFTLNTQLFQSQVDLNFNAFPVCDEGHLSLVFEVHLSVLGNTVFKMI